MTQRSNPTSGASTASRMPVTGPSTAMSCSTALQVAFGTVNEHRNACPAGRFGSGT